MLSGKEDMVKHPTVAHLRRHLVRVAGTRVGDVVHVAGHVAAGSSRQVEEHAPETRVGVGRVGAGFLHGFVEIGDTRLTEMISGLAEHRMH